MQDGNQKSFALYDEVGGIVRDELSQTSDIGDIFHDLDSSSPVELLEESKEFEKKEEETDEFGDLDLAAAALDKSNDSVRVYLREMGMVPLLTREGEIDLAKRIERGQKGVAKALSRSRLIVRTLLSLKCDVESGSNPSSIYCRRRTSLGMWKLAALRTATGELGIDPAGNRTAPSQVAATAAKAAGHVARDQAQAAPQASY